MVNTEAALCGVALKNPVIPASGTFGYGYEFAALYDLNALGAIAVKGTTPAPRFGNPQPRIAECPAGLLNAIGLQNPGLEAVLAEELPRLRACFSGPVIANIAGFSEADYAECAARLGAATDVALLEVNVSCPNVHGGGLSFGAAPESAAAVTRAVKRVSPKPVFVKLSPAAADIAAVARACEDAGADGLCLVNTLPGMRIDLKTRRPLLANKTGGLSGPALLPVALRMVYEVYEAVGIPIIGAGGISSARDVLEMLLAGASAVEVGAANLVNPFACRDIAAALPGEMERYGIQNLSELTGGAHEWEKM